MYIQDAIDRNAGTTEGHYSKACQSFLTQFTGTQHTLLTPSCTHALEMCALLLDIQPEDEVIMSSFNFVSAANAFVLRGAKIVFVDIRPDTMNIDEQLIEAAITEKTKAILAMHYGGVACEMETIMGIAEKYGLKVIEDAAHCIGAYYKHKHLGSIGHLGTLSFHYTKNIHCGEGGALLINNASFIDKAEIIREKGTNRKQFFRGEVDKYSWVSLGSSYLLSELNAAFLYAQLDVIDTVTAERKAMQKILRHTFLPFDHLFSIPPDHEGDNAHVFYVKCKQKNRGEIMKKLAKDGIQSRFHYVPLHTAIAAKENSRFLGKADYTTKESTRLIRFPLYSGITDYSELLFSSLSKIGVYEY